MSALSSLGRYSAGGPLGASASSLLLPRYPAAGGYSLPPTAGGYQPPRETAPAFTGSTLPASLLHYQADAGAAPAAASPSSSSSSAPAASGPIDYSQDPILLKVKALADQQKADAKAAALAGEQQNLIRYGDPELVKTILGKKAGDTAKSAKDNPFSTVAELARWNDRQNVGIDEAANNQNLFYSTARARDRALQGEDYQRNQSKTASQLQDALTQISQALLAAKRQSQAEVLQAEEDAYMRALQEAAAQNYYAGSTAAAGSGGGSSSSGGGSSGGGSRPAALNLAGAPNAIIAALNAGLLGGLRG